ncbi:hypothetical protein RchiOBHm_Chr1g0369051 [Rosa chinensis]|uniref:Uncharacterized protein n=1 Tax=Rosa chinensis TaxID=74649 RepID=A0A2P6SKY7_ROSCH|nr:hypothetical protein RchiOBHm_Chr1g0369051 [Rosa chinensis]
MKSLPPPSLNSSVVIQMWTILHGLRVALSIVRRRVAENVASQRFSQGTATTSQMGYYELNMMNGHKRLVEGQNRLIGMMTEMLSTQKRGQTFAMPTEVKGLS